MRRPVALAVLGALCAALVTATAAGPIPAAGASPMGQSFSGDYATEQLGDPWDFSNPEDWMPLAQQGSESLSSASVSGGFLNFSAPPGGGPNIGASAYVQLGVAAPNDSLPWGRDTALHPIETATYKTISFSLNNVDGATKPGRIAWYTCTQILPTCEGSQFMTVYPGWHTYTIDLSSDAAWAGNVYSIRIVPSSSDGVRRYQLDWLRIVRPGGSTTPVNEPIPVVLDPSRKGGIDYATAVRGDAWDFDQPSDFADSRNLASASVSGGMLHACNANNDPIVYLPIGAPIDGSGFNRMTILIRYDGGFSLSGDPGGGMDLRVYWETDHANNWQPSEDVVVYPGWNEIDLDLSAPDVLEYGATGPGWLGQQITGLRIDPHEDPGTRCFDIADVKLRTTSIAFAGYNIAFRDNSQGVGVTQGGTTADIFLSPSPDGPGGPQIAAGIPVTNGDNVFAWNGKGAPAGTYWVWVRMTDPSGHQSIARASGPMIDYGPPLVVAGSRTRVSSGADSPTSAVLANLTMTDADAQGYITADKCSTLAPGSSSNGNYAPGANIANLSVVPIDPDGSFCVYNERAVQLIADTQGRFSSDGSMSFSPTSPTRVLDTRRSGRPGNGAVTVVHANAPAGATAALVNLTMTEATAAGYITADRCSSLVGGASSNGNYVAGRNIANLAVVPLDPDGTFCIFTERSTNIIADTQGWFSNSPLPGLAFLRLSVTRPHRALDTRTGAKPGDGSITRVNTGAPAGTVAALVNLTMTEAAAAGYITADRCSSLVGGASSNGNYGPGRNIANLSVVPLDPDGTFCIYAERSVSLIADTQGWFSDNGALAFDVDTPVRRLDTRAG
jgi:hypothetical protein